MPYRRTPAVQARLDAQRDAIVVAAAELLTEQGYTSCGIAAVARRAGVAAGTLYSHFATKADLVAEVFRVVVGREVEAVRVAAQMGGTGGTAAERASAVVETFAGRALKQPRRAYALLAEPVDPVVDALRLEFRRTFRDIIADAVAAGVASGELPPQPPQIVAAALVGAVGEALVGPLGGADAGPDTVPALLEFTHRAIGSGGSRHADP